MKNPKKVFIETLGCPKNQKDSELVLADFIEAGYELVGNIKDASAIVINTCSFIDPAKEESIKYIMDAVSVKKETGAQLLVNGCLPELYSKELTKAIPEVDLWLGAKDFSKTVKLFLEGKQGCFVSNKRERIFLEEDKLENALQLRKLGPHSAYVKISEGCSSNCSFCIIPKIRGRIKYRKRSAVLREIDVLLSYGIQEITLIAQDLSYDAKFLKSLLNDIGSMKLRPTWVRLLYCNPWGVDQELIKMIAEYDFVVPYIDFPIQHISNKILKAMNRPTRKKDIIYKLEELRKNNITIRSSVMLGFPGEDEEDFTQLRELIEEGYFHWLGIFIFSPQENTSAYGYKLPDKDLVIERYNELSAIQFDITKLYNESFLGKVLEFIPLGTEDNFYTARTFFQAPEIDGISFFKKPLNKLAKCKVIDTNGIDIFCEEI